MAGKLEEESQLHALHQPDHNSIHPTNSLGGQENRQEVVQENKCFLMKNICGLGLPGSSAAFWGYCNRVGKKDQIDFGYSGLKLAELQTVVPVGKPTNSFQMFQGLIISALHTKDSYGY